MRPDTIETKQIIQPVKIPKVAKGALIVLGIPYSIFILVTIAYGTAMYWVVAIFLGGALAVLYSALAQRKILRRHKRMVADIGPSVRQAMIDFIGAEPKYIDATGTILRDWNPLRVTGTGIALHGDSLYILDDGEIARVPWGLVRSWEWTVQGFQTTKLYKAGMRPGPAAQIQLQANADNANASAAAYRDSGLFVQIADVDRPLWQFRSVDEKTLRRWGEILRQIKEGRIAAASPAE